MRRIFALVLLGTLVSGCAFGVKHNYDSTEAVFEVKSEKSVAVSVVDLRDYVLSGDKAPSFVGLTRGGFGNPFDVVTVSGQPLAEDMTSSIIQSLDGNNIKAIGVIAPPQTTEAAARAALLQADANRFILLLLKEWKTDTYVGTALLHDVTLFVLQKDGTELARKSLNGKVSLGTSVVPSESATHAENVYRRKLETLFNDPGVVTALQ